MKIAQILEAKYFGEPNYSERDADLLINWHEAGDSFKGWDVSYGPTFGVTDRPFIVFMEPAEFESEGPDKRWVSKEDLDPRIWKKVVRVAQFIEKQNPQFVREARYTGGKYADWVRDRTPLNRYDTNELKLKTPQEFETAKAQLITMLGKPKIFNCEVTNKPGCHYRWKIPTRFTFADYIHLYVAWAGDEERMTDEHGYYAELTISPDRDIG